MASPAISIIVPLRDEIEAIPKLHEELLSLLDGLSKEGEIIYVDDSSVDGTAMWIREQARQDCRVQALRCCGCGKSAALWTGFSVAQAPIYITLDGDGQDVPSEIPLLLDALDQGLDFVLGWRRNRVDGLAKTSLSHLLNGILRFTLAIDLHDINTGLRAFRKEIVTDLQSFGEAYRSLAVIAHWRGYRVGEIPVRHRAREHGKSKFGLARLFGFALDLFMLVTYYAWRVHPRIVFGWTGVCFIFIGFVINAWLSFQWFLGCTLSNRPLLLLGVLLMIVGVQLHVFAVSAMGAVYGKPEKEQREEAEDFRTKCERSRPKRKNKRLIRKRRRRSYRRKGPRG